MNTTYCEKCRKEVSYDPHVEEAEYTFRGQKISIDQKVASCSVCGSRVYVEEFDSETISKISNVYAEKFGLTRNQIRDVRSQYKLGIRPFAKIVNIGSASITRYEAGSLPQATHLEIYKQLLERPQVLREYYNRNKAALSEREDKMVQNVLSSWPTEELEFQHDEEIIESIYRSNDSTELAGYTDFSLEKFLQMFIYFSMRGVQKTKLMKLLWYTDFLYFKRQTVSISGATYVKFPYGPVPKEHEIAIAHLQHMDVIEIDETLNAEGWTTMIVKAKNGFNPNLFDEDELETMKEIADRFKSFGSREISDYAHKEAGWINTGDKEPISYKFAAKLNDFQ